MLKIFQYKSSIFYIFSLLLIFILPKGSSFFIDGLPWSSAFEIILICSILPLLLFKNFLKIKKKNFFYGLIILNILNFCLFFSPKLGIAHNQFFPDQKNNEFIKTYQTIWVKNYSAVQKENWNKKTNFPIDWTSRHPLNKDEKNNFKYFKNYDEFINIKLNYISKFNLILNKKTKIIFKVSDIKITKNKFKYKKNNETQFKDFDIDKPLILEKGIYNFNFETLFINKNSKFEVFVEEDNKIYSAFDKRLLFYDLNDYELISISIFKYVGYIFDYLVIGFTLILVISSLYKLKVLNNFFYLSIYYVIICFLFNKANFFFSFDLVGSSVLSVFLLSLLIYFIKKNFFLKFRIEEIYFLISIFIIIYYSYNNYPSIDNITWFSNGDDWEIFQVLGRLIAVDNIWILDEEKITIRRYGIRVYVALLHIIFGKTFYAQAIFEIWAIILSAYFLSKILMIMKIDLKLSLSFGMVLLAIFFGENFRWLIGRGLVEYYSLFIICALAYMFAKNSQKNKLKNSIFYYCCLLGFLLVVFREDHIFIALSLIFFGYYNKKNQNFLINIKNILKKEYISIFIYFTFVIFGFIFILAKNYISFGDMAIAQDALYFKLEKLKEILISNYVIQESPLADNDLNNVFKNLSKINYFDDFYRFFTASEPYNLPRPTSLILISGFVVSLYFLFNIGKFNNILLGIIMTPLANFFIPAFLFTHAYNPRYIISYFPFALITIFVFININKNNLKKYFKFFIKKN